MRTLSVLLLCAASAFAGEGAMNPAERAYLLDVLDSTQKAMIASIQGLSDVQWRFKPAPEVWSVQECAEHIILSEEFLLGTAQKILGTPAKPRLATATPEGDRKFFESIQDRSRKGTAPEPIVPAGKFATPSDAVKEFTARRAKTIAYAKSTDDDLRTHAMRGPVGEMDAYQFLVLLASHSARHTAQIKEVQANAAYPKSSK
jgi:hypothetical protein